MFETATPTVLSTDGARNQKIAGFVVMGIRVSSNERRGQ